MARQATTPVPFQKTRRVDNFGLKSSARAGVTFPCAYAPLLRGDSASGSFRIELDLAEMPRPPMNGIMVNVQAWFVPKSSLPQFSSYDEFVASYHGETIRALGVDDREPSPFFFTLNVNATLPDEAVARTLGIHQPATSEWNTDLYDSFTHVHNFRRAAHSDRLPKLKYVQEPGPTGVTDLPQAFWPSDWRSKIVPDYERALVVGSLDLDVQAGQLDVMGLAFDDAATTVARDWEATDDDTPIGDANLREVAVDTTARTRKGFVDGYGSGVSAVWAELGGETVNVSLAQIDKARETQAFAKMRAAYQGNDINAYQTDEAIISDLMQGFSVPEDMYRRPWLLDSKRVPFGMAERHATDASNLDQSVTKGRAAVSLSINVPKNESGGLIIVTAEVLPERIDERQNDEWLCVTDVGQLPDALRDVQRVEPVDMVLNRRIDVAHATEEALYGYEPMNERWNRNAVRLGGSFFQPDPTIHQTDQRSALWVANEINPTFNTDHYLAPKDFPHYVFSDTTADAVEFQSQMMLTITGLTQFGDTLVENSDDYDAITAE